MASPPKVDALLLCDDTRRDPSTGKRTLFGIWDAVRAGAYPADCGQVAVYVSITGLNGAYRIDLLLLGPDLDTVAHLCEPMFITTTDPRPRHELVVKLEGVEFPRPGRYTVRLLYNGLVGADVSVDANLEDPL